MGFREFAEEYLPHIPHILFRVDMIEAVNVKYYDSGKICSVSSRSVK